MAADDKVGGEATPKKKSSNVSTSFPTFALYRYHANRPKETGAAGGSGDLVEASVSDFLLKEATTDGNFSLSLVSTGLSTEQEAELRKFVAKRLSRGTVYSGAGNILSLELPAEDGQDGTATCYYCLLRQGASIIPDLSDLKMAAMGDSYCSNEFVVCFLTVGDVSLDLFKPELDIFSKDLLSTMDAEPVLAYDEEATNQVENADVKLRPRLERWPADVMEYISRCVARLGEDVKYLIHAALLDRKVIVKGDPAITKDIEHFIDCCSLSELLSQLATTEVLEVTSASSTPSAELGPVLTETRANDAQLDFLEQRPPETITLTVTKNGHNFDKLEKSQFCEDWARLLVTSDQENPILLRQIIDNYKLKAIQDMNTLKRLIRQAETDYYALYRSYVFLKKCGHGAILLRHAWLEHRSLTSLDGKRVLTVLDEYINEVGGLPR